MANIIEWFGGVVDSQIEPHPARARALLLAAYRGKGVQLRIAPDKALTPARQYAAQVCMDSILEPLSHPERAALVNIFMPCELLQAFGISPLFAEATACYLSGADAEKGFIQAAERSGVPETFCSYHKAMLGASLSNVIPRPACVACTSLACDANNLTFRRLSQHYNLPMFYLDVPYARDEAAVAEVADGLRRLADFLAKVTGHPLHEATLREAVARSGRTLDLLRRAQAAKAGKALQNDITSEFYEVFLTHTMLGTPQAETYAKMLLQDIEASPRYNGVSLLWMHAVPYYQLPVRSLLNTNSRAQMLTCDMNLDSLDLLMDPDDPFTSMARRLVCNSFNGGCSHRIARALEWCRRQQADGVVYFNHWGCKQTEGAAQLTRTALEKEGFPVLLLDGDGCDRANTSDGQTATRLGAFVELLEARKSGRA